MSHAALSWGAASNFVSAAWDEEDGATHPRKSYYLVLVPQPGLIVECFPKRTCSW